MRSRWKQKDVHPSHRSIDGSPPPSRVSRRPKGSPGGDRDGDVDVKSVDVVSEEVMDMGRQTKWTRVERRGGRMACARHDGWLRAACTCNRVPSSILLTASTMTVGQLRGIPITQSGHIAACCAAMKGHYWPSDRDIGTERANANDDGAMKPNEVKGATDMVSKGWGEGRERCRRSMPGYAEEQGDENGLGDENVDVDARGCYRISPVSQMPNPLAMSWYPPLMAPPSRPSRPVYAHHERALMTIRRAK